MKRLAKIVALVGLILGATSCEVLLPLAAIGTSAASVAAAAYIVVNAEPSEQTVEQDNQQSEKSHITSVNKTGAHTVVTKSDGSTTTIVDHGAHKIIHNSDGTTATVIDHGAHKIVTKSDGTTSTMIDHGAHKFIHNSDGTTSTVIDHGAHKIVVNPDGSHNVVVAH